MSQHIPLDSNIVPVSNPGNPPNAGSSWSDDDVPLTSTVVTSSFSAPTSSSSAASNPSANPFSALGIRPRPTFQVESSESDSESDSDLEIPIPRRVECDAIPLDTCAAAAPFDYDPTLREAGFDSLYAPPPSFPFGRFSGECSWSAQQRADAFERVNPNSYGREANAAASNYAYEATIASQQSKEAEKWEQEDYPQEELEREVDYAPEGFESFDDYQQLVRMNLGLPPDLEAIVLEYLDFDAIDRLDQVTVMALRLFDQVTLYRQDCLSFGEEWPAISEEAAKEKQAADEMEKRFPIVQESKDNDDEDEGGSSNNEQLFQSNLRNHALFYHLSPHTRQVLLEFSAKLAPYGVEIVTSAEHNWIKEPKDAAGELPSKYLAMVKEALEDEFEAWQELHDDLDKSIELADEEIHFSSQVIEMAQSIFSLPSSGIVVNEELELYEVKEVSPYEEFQEGEAPKKDDSDKNKMDETADYASGDHAAAAANLAAFSSSSAPASSNGEPNPRKRSREEEAVTTSSSSAAVAAAAAAAASSSTGTASSMATDADDADDENADDEECLQSITEQVYQQIINEHLELRPTSIATKRSEHVDKKLKLSFPMEVDDNESECESETENVPWGTQRPTHAVLRDPDYFPKDKERRSKLSAEEKKAEDDHEPNSDDRW